MSEPKSPVEAAVEQALEAFVYAPIGLLFEGPALYPKLVEKGRNQVNMARALGQFAVPQIREEARKAANRGSGQLLEALNAFGGNKSTATEEPAPKAETPAPPAPAPKAERKPAAPDVATLAIPDYDSLAATQVVKRLSGLSAAELEDVRRYETAKRGRKTILNKIGQLGS